MSSRDPNFKFNYNPVPNPLSTGLSGVLKEPKKASRSTEIEEADFLILLMSIKKDGQAKPKLENILRDMPEILIWMMRLIISDQHYHENKDSNTSEALEAMAILIRFLWGETKSSKIMDAKIKTASRLYDDNKRTKEEVVLLKEAQS